MAQHKTPCKECPWRKNSAPGWLGASNPLEFARVSESGARMPCHLAVDYESEDWQEQADIAPQCAGRAIHMRNRCKVVPGQPQVERSDEVFTQVREFIDHHSHGKGPQVTIIGNSIWTNE